MKRQMEDENESILGLDTGVYDTWLPDHMEFGKIKNFDLKRAMSMK